jgi:hypothetical protein
MTVLTTLRKSASPRGTVTTRRTAVPSLRKRVAFSARAGPSGGEAVGKMRSITMMPPDWRATSSSITSKNQRVRWIRAGFCQRETIVSPRTTTATPSFFSIILAQR